MWHDSSHTRLLRLISEYIITNSSFKMRVSSVQVRAQGVEDGGLDSSSLQEMFGSIDWLIAVVVAAIALLQTEEVVSLKYGSISTIYTYVRTPYNNCFDILEHGSSIGSPRNIPVPQGVSLPVLGVR